MRKKIKDLRIVIRKAERAYQCIDALRVLESAGHRIAGTLKDDVEGQVEIAEAHVADLCEEIFRRPPGWDRSEAQTKKVGPVAVNPMAM